MNTTEITNYHILTVKYIGPSNVLGSRVKIISERFKESRTIDYDHSFNNALEIAEAWLIDHGFNIIGHGEGKDHMYVITDTFHSPKRTPITEKGKEKLYFELNDNPDINS
jgi:hypothetical protein